MAYPGDSIETAYATTNKRRGRVGHQIAHTLTTSDTQGYYFIDLNEGAGITDVARCITTRQDLDFGNHKGERSGVLIPIESDEILGIAVKDKAGITRFGRVRKLTPREAWRLQGFTDEQFDKVAALGLSDSRLYKMAGNAVTVPVISALGRFLKDIWTEGVTV